MDYQKAEIQAELKKINLSIGRIKRQLGFMEIVNNTEIDIQEAEKKLEEFEKAIK